MLALSNKMSVLVVKIRVYKSKFMLGLQPLDTSNYLTPRNLHTI